MERAMIWSDIHLEDLSKFMPLVNLEIKKGSKIIIPGADNDLAKNLPILEKLVKDHPDQTLLAPGNHDEGFAKEQFFHGRSFNYYKSLIQMKSSGSYKFLQKLVEDADREYKKENFPQINFAGKDMIVIHGAPLDFENAPKKWNGYLWARVDEEVETKFKTIYVFNPFRIMQIFSYLRTNNKQIHIGAHDHDFRIFKEIKKGFIEYSDTGQAEYEVDMNKKTWKRRQLNFRSIYYSNITAKDELIVYRSGALRDGYFGIMEGNEKGLNFNVFNLQLKKQK